MVLLRSFNPNLICLFVVNIIFLPEFNPQFSLCRYLNAKATGEEAATTQTLSTTHFALFFFPTQETRGMHSGFRWN